MNLCRLRFLACKQREIPKVKTCLAADRTEYTATQHKVIDEARDRAGAAAGKLDTRPNKVVYNEELDLRASGDNTSDAEKAKKVAADEAAKTVAELKAKRAAESEKAQDEKRLKKAAAASIVSDRLEQRARLAEEERVRYNNLSTANKKKEDEANERKEEARQIDLKERKLVDIARKLNLTDFAKDRTPCLETPL